MPPFPGTVALHARRHFFASLSLRNAPLPPPPSFRVRRTFGFPCNANRFRRSTSAPLPPMVTGDRWRKGVEMPKQRRPLEQQNKKTLLSFSLSLSRSFSLFHLCHHVQRSCPFSSLPRSPALSRVLVRQRKGRRRRACFGRKGEAKTEEKTGVRTEQKRRKSERARTAAERAVHGRETKGRTEESERASEKKQQRERGEEREREREGAEDTYRRTKDDGRERGAKDGSVDSQQQ